MTDEAPASPPPEAGDAESPAPAPALSRVAPAVFSVLLGLAVLAVYAWNVSEHWFVGDDAFISFRYAQNLMAGHGLVWNPGERVEGYTNFLWVLLMAAGMRLGVAPELLSCLLGVASGLGILGTLAAFSARGLGWRHPLIWLAPLALSISRSFTAWSTGGLETQFFSLLLWLGFLVYLAERERARPVPVVSSLLFAVATLTRPEGGLFTAVAGVFFLAEVGLGRRRFRSLLIWTLPWFAIVGSHFLWRYAYYGFWLPNTFTAKVPGVWLEQGLKYFQTFQDDYRMLWFLPLALLPLVAWRSFVHGLFAAVLASYAAYVLGVGGDKFEFRFLVVVFPYLYWLLAEGVRVIASRPAPRAWQTAGRQTVAVGLALALLGTTYTGSRNPDARLRRHYIEPVHRTRDYALRRAEEGKFLRKLIDAGLLPDDLVLCVGGAGAVPYYTSWPTVDYRGLSDVLIARTPVTERSVIGHEHKAPVEYLKERRVVIFDVLNKLVHTENPMRYRAGKKFKNGDFWPLHAIRVGNRSLIFATLVPDDEFRRRLGHLDILY